MTVNTYKEVTDMLDYCDISYDYKAGATMFWIHGSKDYAYYWTTGRWNKYGMMKKHYRSKGIQDFLVRFFD